MRLRRPDFKNAFFYANSSCSQNEYQSRDCFMCGIVGLFNPKNVSLSNFNGIRSENLKELCEGMLGLIQHRGPDEMGMLYKNNSFIANARLSILDANNGTQPITNTSEDLWIVYNGEIYDCEKLRNDLILKGYTFKTRTDTEIILLLYEEYGDAFIDKLNGEYAYAILDLRKQKLIIGRDRYGIRPLFYRELERGAYLFSSEIKPLLWANKNKASYEASAFAQTIESWSIIPPRTIYKEIKQLPPNSIAFIDSEGKIEIKIKDIWPPKEDKTHNYQIIKNALEAAVDRRLIADVPIGVYLSGGLDSALISMIATKKTSTKIKSFSIEFDDKVFDESSVQKKLSEWLGTEHHSIRISAVDIVNHFVEAVLSAETVVFRSALVPMMLLSRLVKSTGIKSVLTGEGADEIFGGYDLFKEYLILSDWAESKDDKTALIRLQKLYPYLPQFQGEQSRLTLPFYRTLLEDAEKSFFGHRNRWSGSSNIKKLFYDKSYTTTAEALIENFPEYNRHAPDSQCRLTEILTLLHGYLLSSQGDRMAAANSIETRLPFLDEDLTKIAKDFTLREQLQNMDEKQLLKNAFSKELPDFFKGIKKQPYLAPDAEIFFQYEENFGLASYFSKEMIISQGVFDANTIISFFNRLRNNYKQDRPISRKDNTIFFTVLSSMIIHNHMDSQLNPQNIFHLIKKRILL